MAPTATVDVELGPEIADGCLARLESPRRFELVAVSLDEEYLRYLDAALAEVAARAARPSHREPDLPGLRSAAADVLVVKALAVRADGDRHEPGAGIKRALAGNISNVLLDGLKRRLDPPQPPPTHVDLLLTHDTRGRLDAELRHLVEEYLYPADQPYYRGDGFSEMRSAFIESVLITWLIWDGEGAASAHPAGPGPCGQPDRR